MSMSREDINQQIENIVRAAKSNDDVAAVQAVTILAAETIHNIGRIADSLEKIANNG